MVFCLSEGYSGDDLTSVIHHKKNTTPDMDRKAMGLTKKRGLTKGDHRLQPIFEI
jgi:hypothetical protein